MTLDIIALTIVILLFIRGYMKGIIVAAFSVLAILLGIICALSLSAKLSTYLLDKGFTSTALAPIISYALLFVGVLLLVRLLAKFIEKVTGAVLLGWVNKIIGGLLYAFIGLTVWSSVLWLFNYAHLISPETTVHSRTYPYTAPLAPWVFEKMSHILPFAKTTFDEMRHFFNGVNQQLPEHVDLDR
jgi:membrane protein required for colicin V production